MNKSNLKYKTFTFTILKLLWLLLLLTCPVHIIYADQEVSVAGLQTSFSKAVSPRAVIKNSIRVLPARECKVYLQFYNIDSLKWKTLATYSVKKANKGKLTLKYPSAWKKSRKSRWRIVIPATEGYKEYISETVRITSSRPSKVNLSLSSRSAVIIRASDAYVIFGKNKDRRRPNASTTKMMTALLTMEKGRLNSVTRFSKKAAATDYGCLKVSAGTKFRVRDLLNVMLIRSSNDAASCLAERNAGTIRAFAGRMNRRAKQLGCRNTHFVNPSGLPERNHYSSAYDLALIQRECIHHQLYLDIIKKRSYSFSSINKPVKHFRFDSTDILLGSVKGLLGGKTGYTHGAGQCFCGIYRYKGVIYIFTVLGNETEEGRWNDCRKIMRFIRTYYQ